MDEQLGSGDAGSWLSLVDWFVLGFGLLVALAYFWQNKFESRRSQICVSFKPIIPAQTSNGTLDTHSFVAKMKAAGKNMVVFYGSQTGTAEDLAFRLAKDAVRYGMKAIALDPEEYDPEDLYMLAEIPNSLAVFCMATYGEGDPTDNAREFFEYLHRSEADLSGVNYAVFGLGNKTYEHFNAMGKYTDKQLAKMGATRLCQLGIGDDDGNLEEDFIVWREEFWLSVCRHFNITNVGEDVSIREYELSIIEDCDKKGIFCGEVSRLGAYRNQKAPYHQKNPFLATVTVNRDLHCGGDRTCRHIEFNLTGSRLRYEAGDHLAVYPENDGELVEQFGKLFDVDLDTVFTLTNVDPDSSKRNPFPCPCSFRTALTYYVDISTPPKTNVVKELSQYCSDENEKNFLLSMRKYSEWVIHDHRTLLDILTELPSCRPPLDLVLELLPRLQPRFYSISSSPKVDPSLVSITVIVLKYTTPIGRPGKGVATNYLASKIAVENKPHPQVPIYIRRSQFRLPHSPSTPVVMIGPGTGIAPFRGFIQERAMLKQTGREVGPMILYFGCRKRKEDYLYGQELEAWLKDGTLSELHVAFSRDQPRKVYVQHLMLERKQSIWSLLQNGAFFYVCGDARNMARDVHSALMQIIAEEGDMNADEAAAYFKQLESQKRYQADVWSTIEARSKLISIIRDMRLNRRTSVSGRLVVLIPYDKAHVARYHQWMQCDILRTQTGSEKLSLEDEYKMQQSWQDDDDKLTFIVVAKQLWQESRFDDLGAMVGDVNLFFTPACPNRAEEPFAEVEVMIAEPAWRGRGLGKEAVKMLLVYAFQHLHIERFVAKIRLDNEPSLALFQSLQFKQFCRVDVFQELHMELILHPDMVNAWKQDTNYAELGYPCAQINDQMKLDDYEFLLENNLALDPIGKTVRQSLLAELGPRLKHNSSRAKIRSLLSLPWTVLLQQPDCSDEVTVYDYLLEHFGDDIQNTTIWDRYYLSMSSCRMYNSETVVDQLLNLLVTMPIQDVKNMEAGTQLKLLITFQNNYSALFKPMRQNRDEETNPNHFYFSDFERHNAEIAAYHLDRILKFYKAIPTVGRRINVTADIEFNSKLSPGLNDTFFLSPAKNKCFYGKCLYYCDFLHPICGNPDMIEGSMQIFLPDEEMIPTDYVRSPFRRTYSRNKQLAEWQYNKNFCNEKVVRLKPYNNGTRLLEMIDAYIFDFLIGNQDRHHFEFFNLTNNGHLGFIMNLDNGRGFGDSKKDDFDILAPLVQCCMIRPTTLKRLLDYYFGPVSLSTALNRSMASDPLAPVLADKHLLAIDRRLEAVLLQVSKCINDKEGHFDQVVRTTYSNDLPTIAAETVLVDIQS
ncbi:NADPH--cytochrome P450 reductase [Trichinella papuae]|uniref:NADPH--cytochrome P450 reductase n=1 Tax=Trichinella papuae TaxID=268474 RepID=A0A0V1N0A5_9BILA|nr:NADPH--cytochrome P450 reductase [Trichinella papuae]